MGWQRNPTNFLASMCFMSFVSVDGVSLARNRHVHTARKKLTSREYLVTRILNVCRFIECWQTGEMHLSVHQRIVSEGCISHRLDPL